MKLPKLFSLWTLSALAVCSALTTSLVAGTDPHQEKTSNGIVEAVTHRSQDSTSTDISLSATDLDVSKLHRTKTAKIEDGLFGVAPPPPPPPPPIHIQPVIEAPPPKPVAPPLPFRFLGRLIDQDQVVIFVAQVDQNISLHQGDTIDNLYRVESIDDQRVVLTYLPLNEQQVMNIGSSN